MTVKIEKVSIKWNEDINDSANMASFMGEYKHTPNSNKFYVNRARGMLYGDYTDENDELILLANSLSTKRNSREYNYFISGNHGSPGSKENWAHVSAEEKAQAYAKCDFAKHGIKPENLGDALTRSPEFWLDIFYFCEDYERYEDLNDGNWRFLTCEAQAIISFDTELGPRTEVVSSGSLGGIESDMDKATQKEFEKEQLELLKEELSKLLVELDLDTAQVER